MKKRIYLFIYVVVCITLIGFLYHFPISGIDDANIYFVYMRNFAAGNGFVYNVGGERVEGFTSILWTLMGSCFFKLTTHIEFCLMVVNVLLLYVTLLIYVKIINQFIPVKKESTNYTILFLGLLLVFPGFYEWNFYALLETGLWTFELALICYLLIVPYFKKNVCLKKTSLVLSIFFPFFILSRPESILLGLLIIAIRFIQLMLEKESKVNILQQITPLITVYGLSLFLLTKWRLYYFGYPFPNTYYIKMTDGFINNLKEGALYFLKYIFWTNPLLLLTILLILLWLFKLYQKKEINKQTKIAGVLILLTAIGIVIPFYTGGDHFRLSRFYQAFAPIFYISTLFILYSLFYALKPLKIITHNNQNTFLLLLLLSLLPLHNIYYLFLHRDKTILMEFNIAKHNRQVGNNLNAFFKNSPKPSIGVVAAGGIAYTYKGNINDVLGLNNTAVAHTFGNRPKDILKSHRAFNKAVFLKQLPDLFLFDIIKDTTTYIPYYKRQHIDDLFGSKVIKHIYKDAAFNKLYTFIYIYNIQLNEFICTYASNSFITTIKNDAQYKLFIP